MYHMFSADNRNLADVKPGRLRREGWIPGVVYGKNIESIPIQMDYTKFAKFLREGHQVFELQVASNKHLVSLDVVQREPVSHKIIHVSFHKLAKNQKTYVSVPLILVGTAPGVKEGGVVTQAMDSVEVCGLPADIPETIEVCIDGLTVGHHINLKDVTLPRGIEWSDDPEKLVVNCNFVRVQEEEPAETEAAAEGEAPAAEAPADNEPEAA